MDLIPAGKIVNTHGVRGEFKAEVWLDSVSFLKKYHRIFIGAEEKKILRCSDMKGFAIISLEGLEDVNEAMKLKGREFSVCREDVRLSKGSYFVSDIIGSEVLDESGKSIGVLEDAFESPAHLVYVVKGELEHLIPAIPEFVISTDIDRKQIVVRLIEGM